MAVLEIKKYPDIILREKSLPVDSFDDGLQKLIDDMIETMYAAPGVGLAAVQVGVLKRVLVMDVSSSEETGGLLVLINPEIIDAEGSSESEEGCLSIPDYTTIVKRSEYIRIRGLDRDGNPVELEGSGLKARALQHEMDHLNGLLFVDRIGRIKKSFFRKRYAREKAAGIV